MKIRPLMLTPTFAKNVKVPGRYGDGRGGLGLSLLVRPASRGGFTKSWTQSVRIGGRPTSLGLGRYPVVTLAMARERALENARAIADGRDPRGGSPRGVPTFAQALDELAASSGHLPDKMSLDNGYYSGENLEELSDRDVEAHIATDRGEKPAATGVDDGGRPLVKADFRYDEGRDGFHCPGGQFLALRRVGAQGRREYRGEAEACAACAYHDRCCRSKFGAARTVTSDGREPLRRAMNERMSRPEGRAIYRRRKAIAEPVFGQIRNTGFRGFGVRGMSRVDGEFSLVCAAHNIKKMVNAAIRGSVRPEFGRRAAMAWNRARGISGSDETVWMRPFSVEKSIARRPGSTSLGRERVVGATDMGRYASAGAECRQVPCSRTAS